MTADEGGKPEEEQEGDEEGEGEEQLAPPLRTG